MLLQVSISQIPLISTSQLFSFIQSPYLDQKNVIVKRQAIEQEKYKESVSLLGVNHIINFYSATRKLLSVLYLPGSRTITFPGKAHTANITKAS